MPWIPPVSKLLPPPAFNALIAASSFVVSNDIIDIARKQMAALQMGRRV